MSDATTLTRHEELARVIRSYPGAYVTDPIDMDSLVLDVFRNPERDSHGWEEILCNAMLGTTLPDEDRVLLSQFVLDYQKPERKITRHIAQQVVNGARPWGQTVNSERTVEVLRRVAGHVPTHRSDFWLVRWLNSFQASFESRIRNAIEARQLSYEDQFALVDWLLAHAIELIGYDEVIAAATPIHTDAHLALSSAQALNQAAIARALAHDNPNVRGWMAWAVLYKQELDFPTNQFLRHRAREVLNQLETRA